MTKTLFILIFVFSFRIQAHFETSDFLSNCSDINFKTQNKSKCLNLSNKTLEEATPKLSGIERITKIYNVNKNLLIQEGSLLLKYHQDNSLQFNNFFRYLKGEQFPNKETKDFRNFFKNQKLGFIKIQETYRLKLELKKKLSSCGLIKCSRNWTNDLEGQIKTLSSLNNQFKILYPLVATKSLYQQIENDSMIYFKEILKANLNNKLMENEEAKKKIRSFLLNYKNQINPQTKNFSSSIHHPNSITHGSTIDTILNFSFLNWNLKNSTAQIQLCNLAKERISIKKSLKHIKTSINIGLTGLSLIPSALALTSTARFIRSQTVLKTIPTISRGNISTNLLKEIDVKTMLCREKKQIFALNPTQTSMEIWQNCLKNESKLKREALISSLPFHLVGKIPNVLKSIKNSSKLVFTPKKLKRPPNPANEMKLFTSFNSGKESYLTYLKDNTNYTLLNLSKLSATLKPQGKAIADNYWKFAINTYNKRLKLTEKELKEFLKASQDMNKRTRLVITTRGPPKRDNIEGGVAIIESKNSKELLPFEFETGLKVKREGKKSVEISRLISTAKSKTAMQDILAQMAHIIKNDKEISQVFVYTSKVHYRLYKKLGIKGEIIKSLGKRDVIIKISPEQISELAKF